MFAMLQVKINDELDYKVEANENGIVLNDSQVNPDISDLGENKFHVIHNHKSYNIEVIRVEGKNMSIKVNDNIYQAKVSDSFDLLLEKMGISNALEKKAGNLNAPMPGLVLSIEVEEGATIQKGDALLVLEAMKMENVIKASGDGIIKSIKATKGEAVEKGELLIEFE